MHDLFVLIGICAAVSIPFFCCGKRSTVVLLACVSLFSAGVLMYLDQDASSGGYALAKLTGNSKDLKSKMDTERMLQDGKLTKGEVIELRKLLLN